MAQLSNKIKEYAKANGVAEVDFLEDVLLQDDGQGAYIKEWNLDIAQPIQAQLDALDAQADFNVAMKNLRAKRDKLLADSDWRVIKAKETGGTLSVGFKAYRQALRDLPSTVTDEMTAEDVNNIQFPTE